VSTGCLTARRLGVYVSVALGMFAASAAAQQADVARQARAVNDPTAYRIQFKPHPDLKNGKIAMIEGTAGPQGMRFVAEYLSILQPIVVTVLSKDPNDDVRVALSKYRYDEADRTGTTKGEGMFTTQLRTQGDLKIVVSSQERKPFQLVVWAGDEVERPMKPVLVANRAKVTGEEGWGIGGSAVTWVIAGSLMVIAGFLGVIVLRGKRS
jgi:hypothetical protein